MTNFSFFDQIAPAVRAVHEAQRITAQIERKYPELRDLTSPFETDTSKAETLKVYQKINGCPHPEACDCFLSKVSDDTTPDDSSLGTCHTNGCMDNCIC